MGLYIGGQKVSPIIKVGEINNQDKTITENGTYTADAGYTGLGEVTVSVPSVQPVITELNVTPTTSAQTINPPSGVHGHAPVNVAAVTSSIDNNIIAGNIKKDVQILGVTGTYEGSGGIGITREVSATGVYQIPATNFTFSLPSNATNIGSNAIQYAFYNCSGLTRVDLSSLTTISGSNAMQCAFQNCSGLTSVDLSSLTTISGSNAMKYAFQGCTNLSSIDLSGLTSISGSNAMNSTFQGCTNLSSIDLSGLTALKGGNAMQYAFQNCSGLTSVDFSNLTQIGNNGTSSQDFGQFVGCFQNCYTLTTLNFPKLEKIYCTASPVSAGTFSSCNTITKMYFPKLDTITYATGAASYAQTACKNIFYNCSGLTELHFAAANQAAIEATAGYSTAWGRGAGKVTIYFDL